MIYFISKQQELFDSGGYKTITVEESLRLLEECSVLQADTETDGRDANINKLLSVQLGSKIKGWQIVIDCSTIDIKLYKSLLESKLLILHNAKFDLQFFYSYGIIPRRVYDTMIVEQLLHLGYPSGIISYSLKSIAKQRLNVDMDKSIRGEIIWRGLDAKVIKYAADDVVYLEDIMWQQVEECKKKQCLVGAKLECDAIPAIAYCEWCGIKLDENKWKLKMDSDSKKLEEAKKTLNTWFISEFNNKDCNKIVSNTRKTIGYTPYSNEEYNKYLEDKKELESLGYKLIKEEHPGSNMAMHMFIYENINVKPSIEKNPLSKYIKIDRQGDLFTGFNIEPQCTINWSSSKQVVEVAKILGFNTTVQDKKTGEDKDSVLEKILKPQKGINDEFLKLYFNYQEQAKVVSTYGQAQLNMINPNTGRCHTVYKQLGASSGRMSCGSQQSNTDLAKLKKIKASECTYCNFQQLPADEPTRSAFVAEEGNVFCSCDWSSLEARLGADIYNEPMMIEEYLHGAGDQHSLVAKACFPELKDVDVHDIKKLYPNLRKKAKPVGFAMQFGGSALAVSQNLQCSLEEAETIVNNYMKTFSGISAFKNKGSKFVRQNGYVLMNKYTGHKMYWWDHDKWLERQKSFTQEFWEEYRTKHKGTGDNVAMSVKEHFQAASKWDRMALNAPTQGCGSNCLKRAITMLFNWIVDNNYFHVILLTALVHDETCWDYPKELEEGDYPFSKRIADTMEKAAAEFCKALPVPAEPAVGDHWIH